MGSVFIRRFGTDPGNSVLLEIESVNILDLDPPASISGIGTGTVSVVGEFEDGPFATPTEVSGTTDFVNTFGQLGYTYGGVVAQNPCARARRADGALVDEYWNGNAFVQLNAKKFKRLICVRVDTSVGAVELRRQAYVTGAAAFTYNLEPSQVLGLDIGAGSVSSTFTATAATVTSGAGTYNTTFTGGETLVLGYDAATNFTVTFLAADQTKAQVVARINQYAGFTFVAAGGGATIVFTGIQRGNAAQIRVVSGSSGVLTTLGLTAGTTVGTGNVSNIDAATFPEIKTIVEAAMSASVTVEQDSQGRLRFSKNYVAATDYIGVTSATTALALGLVVGQQGSNDGVANLRSGAQTFVTVGTGVLTLGVDSEANFNVTIGAGQSQATVITNINAAAGYTMAATYDSTHFVLRGRANGGQVRVVGAPTAVLADLGLAVGVTSVPALVAGTIAAGTRVSNAANTLSFVLMQSTAVNAPTIVNGTYTPNGGPYTIRIRHALDDGTGTSATAGALVKIDPPDLGSFQCVNPQIVTAALSESAIDALYSTATDSTLSPSAVSRQTNVIFAARQSNVVRRALRANAVSASANGLYGRMAVVRTPMGTTKAAALSRIAEPGVGAYRSQRVIYCWPQASTFVPLVARRGTSGGAGFTATGNVDAGADGFMASILSQLAPEENPGQVTPFTDGVVGLESSSNAAGLLMEDYVQFRANGVAALRLDDGDAIFQSGVTSVDPLVEPQLRNIARRRMADFIQDTLALRAKAYGKKLSTFQRRKALASEIITFVDGLLSRNNPALQRIAGYTVDSKTGNTADTLALGLYRIILNVRTLASLDSIVLECTVGESVTVQESLPQAA